MTNTTRTRYREQVHLASGDFVFRGADLDADVPRLVTLVNAVAAADGTEDAQTEDELRADLTSPSFDPGRDEILVEHPDDPTIVIAEAFAWRVAGGNPRAYVGGRVLPAWRRRGLGTALLARALARAREQQAAYVDSGAETRQAAGHAFLQQHGFQPVQTWVEMRFPPDAAVPAPVWPDGYTLRTYDAVQDPAVLTEALNRGFIGHWENRERTDEETLHRLEGPSVRPEGIFLAFGPVGDVAGVCWTDISAARNERRGESIGYINSLAVVPEHRRYGLGRALLLTGMQWLRAQGQRAVELDAVGDNEMALPLYEAVGYGVRKQGTDYRQELT